MKHAPGSPAALVAAAQARRPASSTMQRRRAHGGNVVEKFVRSLNEACFLAGVARVEKNNANVHPVKNIGPARVEAVMTEKTGADFTGQLADGRAVAVEVKGVALAFNTGRKVRAVSLGLSRVEPHQIGALDWCDKHGGLALLLIVHGAPPMVTAYAVPWREVRASGLRTLGEAFLAPWKINPGVPYLRRFLTETP